MNKKKSILVVVVADRWRDNGAASGRREIGGASSGAYFEYRWQNNK